MKSRARYIAEEIFSTLAADRLRVVELLGEGRFTIPRDTFVLAALEVAISEALEHTEMGGHK